MNITVADGAVLVDGEPVEAQQLQQVIRRLCLIRSQMEPPVPHTLPQDQKTLVQRQPTIELTQVPSGDITLALRHQGLGWCVFTLPPRQAAFLRDGLVARTRGVVIDVRSVDAGDPH